MYKIEYGNMRDHCSRCARSLLALLLVLVGVAAPHVLPYIAKYIYRERERERDKEMVIERGIGMEKYSEIMGEVYRDIEGF